MQCVDNSKDLFKFQFHYGSIKRTDTIEGVLETATFQFHYGSIKSKL